MQHRVTPGHLWSVMEHIMQISIKWSNLCGTVTTSTKCEVYISPAFDNACQCLSPVNALVIWYAREFSSFLRELGLQLIPLQMKRHPIYNRFFSGERIFGWGSSFEGNIQENWPVILLAQPQPADLIKKWRVILMISFICMTYAIQNTKLFLTLGKLFVSSLCNLV